ncbi:MAG: PAS domain S-box-containing protein [Parasphingorhabdus sp.]
MTERINKEAELAASEERYQLITRASSDGIYEWDIGTDSLFVSDKLKQMFGFGAESLQSRRWASAIHRDDYDQYLSSVVEHIKGNTENLQCEYRIEGADGVYRWVRDHGIGVRGKSGRVQRLVGAVSDITDIMAAEAELDQATSRLLDSLETISDGFLLVDSNDRVQLFNRRYLEIFGGTIDSDISDIVFIGQPFMTMIREGYNHGMFKPVSGGVDTWIAARRKAREKPAAELEMELSNGSWLLVNERQMTDGGRVSVYTDVTEFKKRELELKTAHSRFADAIEALSTGFALFDSQDRLIVCNTKYTEYFPQLADHVRPGIPFADLIRAGVERGLFPEAVNNWDSWFTGLQKQRTTSDGIREQHMKGGLWLQISDHRTKEGGIVSIYTDVSELKKREEELHQQSTVLKATLENMDQGISMVDENLNVVSFNHKFLEYLQFPDEQFTIGFPMEQAFRFNALRGEYGEGDIDQQVAQRLELASRFEPHRFERVRKDKTVLEIVGIPVSGGGFVTTYTDITPKKQREVELISARDAAQQALRDLELAQERLVQSEKMASLGQLTAGIAHEIKNPLNFVNNFAKLSQELLEELNEIIEAPLAALAQDPREDAEELLGLLTSNLGKIDQHGRRADSIVKNMLLHSRDGPSISQSVDLNGLVDEALNLAYHGLRAENPNLNVELIKNFSAEVGQVECFPQDLMRVFLNLMSNGIYASNQRYLQIDVSQPNASPDTFSPTLIVTTMTLNDQITIEVTDNGVGISDDIRDKLFLPFFTTKPAGEGTGLGLSLSYDIVVKQHGGELSVESQLGDYATFKVTLPCSLPKDINTPGGEE